VCGCIGGVLREYLSARARERASKPGSQSFSHSVASYGRNKVGDGALQGETPMTTSSVPNNRIILVVTFY